MGKFYKINNRNEFISFVENMRGNFDCPEDWEQFFGFRLKSDEDGNELETLKEYAQEHYIDSECSAIIAMMHDYIDDFISHIKIKE